MLSIVRMMLNKIIGNELVVKIIMTLIENLLTYGNKLAKPCLVYIVEASGMEMSNEDRFNYVLKKLEADFPSVASSFLKTIIETTYDSWDAGKLN